MSLCDRRVLRRLGVGLCCGLGLCNEVIDLTVVRHLSAVHREYNVLIPLRAGSLHRNTAGSRGRGEVHAVVIDGQFADQIVLLCAFGRVGRIHRVSDIEAVNAGGEILKADVARFRVLPSQSSGKGSESVGRSIIVLCRRNQCNLIDIVDAAGVNAVIASAHQLGGINGNAAVVLGIVYGCVDSDGIILRHQGNAFDLHCGILLVPRAIHSGQLVGAVVQHLDGALHDVSVVGCSDHIVVQLNLGQSGAAALALGGGIGNAGRRKDALRLHVTQSDAGQVAVEPIHQEDLVGVLSIRFRSQLIDAILYNGIQRRLGFRIPDLHRLDLLPHAAGLNGNAARRNDRGRVRRSVRNLRVTDEITLSINGGDSRSQDPGGRHRGFLSVFPGFTRDLHQLIGGSDRGCRDLIVLECGIRILRHVANLRQDIQIGELVPFEHGAIRNRRNGFIAAVQIDPVLFHDQRLIRSRHSAVEPVYHDRAAGGIARSVRGTDCEGTVFLHHHVKLTEIVVWRAVIGRSRIAAAGVERGLGQAVLVHDINGDGEAIGIFRRIQARRLRHDTAEIDLRSFAADVRHNRQIAGKMLHHVVKDGAVAVHPDRDPAGLVGGVAAQVDGGIAALALAACGGEVLRLHVFVIAARLDASVEIEVDGLSQGVEGEGHVAHFCIGCITQVGDGGFFAAAPLGHSAREYPGSGFVRLGIDLLTPGVIPGEAAVVLENIDAAAGLSDRVGDVHPGIGVLVRYADDTAALVGGAENQVAVRAGAAGAHVVIQNAHVALIGRLCLTVKLVDLDHGHGLLRGSDGQRQAHGGAQRDGQLLRSGEEAGGLQRIVDGIVVRHILIVESGDKQAVGRQGTDGGIVVEHGYHQIQAASGSCQAIGVLGYQNGTGDGTFVACLQIFAIFTDQTEDAVLLVIVSGCGFDRSLIADLKAAVGDVQRRVDRLLIVGVAFLNLLHGPSALIGELDVRSHGVCRTAVGDLHIHPDLDHLLTADGLDTQGAELQVFHSQLRLVLDFPGNTTVQRAVFEGRIDIFSVFAHGEVDLASHEIFRQRFGIIAGAQLGGYRLTHRDVFGDLPRKELFAKTFAALIRDAQLHNDGICLGTKQRDVAGVFEGHHGTQPRAGHKVGRLEGNAGLAHTLFTYAEGQDVDAGGGVHSTVILVLAGDDLCALFAVELSFLQLGLGAPGQNNQRGLIHCAGCALRVFRSFGRLRQPQRHCQITEGEGGHQAPFVRLIALQFAVVGLLGLLGVPAVGDGVLIDLHLVHGQHAALAELLGV